MKVQYTIYMLISLLNYYVGYIKFSTYIIHNDSNFLYFQFCNSTFLFATLGLEERIILEDGPSGLDHPPTYPPSFRWMVSQQAKGTIIEPLEA